MDMSASPSSRFQLRGLSCAGCAARAEKAIGQVAGVESVAVNFATSTAQVIFSGDPDPARVIRAVEEAGYAAALDREEGDRGAEEAQEEEIRRYRRAAAWAAVLTTPIVILDMGGHFFPVFQDWLEGWISGKKVALLLMLLASLVQFGPGGRFYVHGLKSLRRGAPDMNALVMLGTSAAWLYSTIAVLAPAILPAGAAHLYYEASAVIITLVLVGRWLEARTRGKTSQAIQRLARLRPATARVKRGNEVVEIPVEEVQPGDLVVLRPGEKLPVDGEVVEGETHVDQSMMTGEPVPVRRGPGDPVIGGTINTTGRILYRATSLGSESVLARIIEMVRNAQGAKLPIQALVDRVTAVFVPVVLGLAGLTFAVWMFLGPTPALALAVVNAVAVLIIACPCAMGLATPTSIMVGTGRGAGMGILFRRGDALQSLAGCTVVAFDKTGTLTMGAPTLIKVGVTEGMGEAEALQLAASVEEHSEHPIARAVVAAAREKGLRTDREVGDFTAVSGLGVQAQVEGSPVLIGSRRFLEEEGIRLLEDGFTEEDFRLGTVLYLARDGQHAATLAVRDPIRETTPEAVRILRESGFTLAMITGDSSVTAQAIADELGIDKVAAEVLPEGKVEAVKQFQESGKVAFVGDGINDAPALAAAEVGIAIGTATDVAMESAEVVLVTGDLRKVAAAIRLSRATLRNIRQNLFWAFAYNAALIPVAAGILYPFFGILLSPILAAVAMTLSSLCVLTNALRLKKSPL